MRAPAIVKVLAFSFAVAGSAAADAGNAHELSAQGHAAYDRKEYIQCGKLLLQAGTMGDLYDGACCFALGQDKDAAFNALTRAVDLGYTDGIHLAHDQDLASLRGDARWAKLLVHVAAKLEETLKTVDRGLRAELVAMRDEDQKARFAYLKPGSPASAKLRVVELDRKHAARFKQIVAARGWPTISLAGHDGAQAAWLLVQHFDHDVAFQKACLAKMQAALAKADVSPADVAFLVDRVAVNEGRKQTYGTQFRGTGAARAPAPIEDEAHVDERRHAVGLGTMAEYRRDMERMYGAEH